MNDQKADEIVRAYLAPYPKLIFLSMLKAEKHLTRKQRSGKYISTIDVLAVFKDMCRKFDMEDIPNLNIRLRLNEFDTYGLIKTSDTPSRGFQIKRIGSEWLLPDELEEAIYRDPEFEKFRTYIPEI